MKNEATRRLIVLMTVLSFSEFRVTVIADGHQVNVYNSRNVSSLLYVLEILSWKNIVVLYTSDTDDLLLKLFQGLENSRLNSTQSTIVHETLTLDSVSNMTKFITTIYKQYLYNDLNIIILLPTEADITKEEPEISILYDIILRGTSDTILNTKSKWLLFFTGNTTVVNRYFRLFTTNLTNVAHVFPNPGDDQPAVARTLFNGHFQPVIGNLSTENIFPRTPYKFNSNTLIIGFIPHGSPYEDSLMKFLNIASGNLNFTYRLERPLDGEYGHYSNGAWSGLVGQLVRHEVDMVLATLSMIEERRQVVDFIRPPLQIVQLGIIYKKEPSEDDTWFLLLRPIQNIVYAYMLLSYILIALFILFLSREESNESLFQRVLNTFFFVLGCLFLEGNHCGYKGLSVRILLTSWLLFCVVLGAIYSGNLTRSLIPRELRTFDTVQELINKPGWQIGLLGGSSSIIILSTSKNKENALLWTTILNRSTDDPSIMSTSEHHHMDRVLKGKYAFIIENVVPLMKIRNDCLLDVREDILDLPSIHMSMAVPKGSPFKLDIDLLMSKLHTSGLLDVVMETKDNRPLACHIVDHSVKPLYMYNTKGAFGILTIGVGLSALILIVEILVKTYMMT